MNPNRIPGYDFGSNTLAHSPISLSDLELLKTTLLFGDEDVRYLQISRDVLEDQAEAVVSMWHGFVGQHPHLLRYFTRVSDGQPDMGYIDAVRQRVIQWVQDTAEANYDQTWLDYQYEIAKRHHRTAKNQTDKVDAFPNISFRYLPAFVSPLLTTLRPFLAKKGHSVEDVERMYTAWLKAVLLHVVLWSMPYVKDGDF
jgi:hypothetical protein